MSVTAANIRKSPFWWVGYVPAALLLLYVGWLMIYAGAPVLIPLLFGFALAFILEPVVDWFQKRGSSRNIAVLLTLALSALCILLVAVLLLPGIYSQLRESIEKLPLAVGAANVQLRNLLVLAHERFGQTVFTELQNYIDGFEKDPSALTSRVGSYLSEGLFGLINLSSATVGLLIVPFFVYYLLLDLRNVRAFLEKRLPERYRGVGSRLFGETGVVVRGYVRGRFLIALIQSAVYALGLYLLGVPLWAAIGVIAGFVGIIPYFGVVAGAVLALGFSLLDGASAVRLLGVIAYFAAAQTFEDYVLTPKIIGGKLDLHPMFVFIALIIGGSLFGLLGLVIAIPVLGVIRVFLKFVDEIYLRSDFYLQPASTVGDIPDATIVQRAADATVSGAKDEAETASFAATREEISTKKEMLPPER